MKFSPSALSKPLRRRLSHETLALLIAGLVAATHLAACKSAPVPQRERQSGTQAASQPATQANSGAAQSNAITAQRLLANGLGEPVLLRPGAATDIILSATWCPTCLQMDQVLRDPALAPYLRGRNLVFLFVNEHHMGEPPEGSEAVEHQGDLSPYLLHPERIRSLPGAAYLWTDPPAEPMQFPTLLTANGSMSELQWLINGLGVPQETLALAFSRASAPRK